MKGKFLLNRGSFCLDTEFEVPDAGITVLFGPSGSGKTSMLRCVAGLDRSPEGFFKINEDVWQNEAKNFFSPPFKRKIGYIFQDVRLFSHLTAEQNLLYGYKRLSESERKFCPSDVIDWLSIQNLLNHYPHQLSGGEKQRIGIGRALLTSPELLLWDEPLASLDRGSKAEILTLIESVYQKFHIPSLYVTHSLDEVLRLADFVLLFKDGKIVASGSAFDLVTNLDLPLAEGQEAGTILEAQVSNYDSKFHLTYLDFEGEQIAVSGNSLEIGSSARAYILAKDVSLTLKRPKETSMLNVFKGTIYGIRKLDDARVLVRLGINQKTLLSRITNRSFQELKLCPGREVYAQFKSVALVR